MPKILVTGGCGYIGSHTAIEILAQDRYEVISVDNNVNSSPRTLDRIEAITGKRMKNYAVDLCDWEACKEVFEENEDIIGVIHFAALKAVGESVAQPLRYYQNNLISLVNVLRACETYKVANFIFSSSCSVYGNVAQLPVNEDTPTSEPESPYAMTKLMGERIIRDFLVATEQVNAISLRYFNPVGAHESGLNGEDPQNKPNNLVPIIAWTAAGIIPKLTVFGSDYETRDGTAIRDYLHVTDLADAHIRALDYLVEGKNERNYDLFNLGSGNGVSVLEAIHAFEEATGKKLNYELGARRPGDVMAIYSDSTKAKELLGWEPTRGIEMMMATAWKWQETLLSEKENA